MKPEDCHYYEPKNEDFDSCPVRSIGAAAISWHCVECCYNVFEKRNSEFYAEVNHGKIQ